MRYWIAFACLLGCSTRDTDLVPLPPASMAPPMPPPPCASVGAACTDDASCCMAMPPVHCKPDAPGLSSKHCVQDPAK